MIGRLIKGLVLGLVIGGLAAGALIKGLAVTGFDSGGFDLLAYLAALVTGAATGLLAGKPIWAKGAGIEAVLKTVFGAALGAGAMFLLQRFPGPALDLTKLGLGAAAAGHLSVVAFPALATVLSVFFELDNTDSPEAEDKHVRVSTKTAPKLRVATDTASALDDDEAEPAAAVKKAKK
jgi:hypothetical protein